MKHILLTLAVLGLVGCGDNDAAKPSNEPHAAKCSKDLAKDAQSMLLLRCENDEVICYANANHGGMVCKWKGL